MKVKRYFQYCEAQALKLRPLRLRPLPSRAYIKPSRNLAVPIVERGCRAGQERGGKKSIERKLVIWEDVGVKEGV